MRNLTYKLLTFLLIGALFFITSGCKKEALDDHGHGHGHGHGHSDEHEEEFEKGKHGGRLFREGAFSLELQIFESGVPPQFRVYGYNKGSPLSAESYAVTVELSRLGREKEEFVFKPLGAFQVSDKEVSEPHSFDVQIKAQLDGKTFSWSYSSYEGRTEILEEVAKVSGIKIEKAEGRRIISSIPIRGKVTPSEHKIAHVVPRFSGVVREGRKHIGDTVQKGEILAIIESNQSLQPFEVRSQISGTVVNGHVIVGEYVPENQWIYIVADLSEVWGDFFMPLRENSSLVVNQKIEISTVNGDITTEGVVSYVAPYADERSQSQLLRVVIPNPQSKFLPGMFVVGNLVTSERSTKVAVKKTAIQNIRGHKVVFRQVGNIFEAAPIELGVSDGDWIEVLSGLLPGDSYVSENSYLIKADILKSGASHDH